ncbi:hypothetical protein FY557_13230 [Chryseobacterium sp. SN22]|uniref:hypothetical protein n=1 Tax=Chryseobacterium sp. SN22 TaxID=2606431 RepID=UPI0011EDEAAC|nr:hypothetical protein [Chryseobacterium sp. SN22]KAA0127339.1 hypothetical protein FY557_13230 [Chryseobacterium sp. SN22]
MKKNILILLLPVFLTGCKDFKKSIDDTLASATPAGDSIKSRAGKFQDADSSTEPSVPFASVPEKLELAERQLRDLPRFRGNPVYIFEYIHFYPDGRIIVKIQTPENPDFVDEYTYEDGQWQKPEPVVLSKNDNVKARLVSLDEIPFKNANNVYKVLVEKDKEIGSKNENQVIFAGKRKNKIVWSPGTISNERSRYDIDYHENGTLKSFEQK